MNLFSHKKASALTRGFVTALMMLTLIGGQFLIEPSLPKLKRSSTGGQVMCRLCRAGKSSLN